MAEERKLFGLRFLGNHVHDAAMFQGTSIAVAMSKKALGVPLWEIDLCTCEFPDVPNQPGDGKLINVVIGDPYLLTKVKVVARYQKNSGDLPDDVCSALYPDTRFWDHSSNEVIVFENADGEHVYVEACYTTLLENVIDEIDQELLSEHLRDT